MSLDMFEACIQGYEDQLFDQQIVAVHTGYWSAYFQTKHPKPLSRVVEELIRGHEKSQHAGVNKPRPEVDVESFLAQERAFEERLRGETFGERH